MSDSSGAKAPAATCYPDESLAAPSEARAAGDKDSGRASSPSSGGSGRAWPPELFEGASRCGRRPVTTEPEGHRSDTATAGFGGCAAERVRGEVEETPRPATKRRPHACGRHQAPASGACCGATWSRCGFVRSRMRGPRCRAPAMKAFICVTFAVPNIELKNQNLGETSSYLSLDNQQTDDQS